MFYQDFLSEIDLENQARIQVAKEIYDEQMAQWEEKKEEEYQTALSAYEAQNAQVIAEQAARHAEAMKQWEEACKQVRVKNKKIEEEIECVPMGHRFTV